MRTTCPPWRSSGSKAFGALCNNALGRLLCSSGLTPRRLNRCEEAWLYAVLLGSTLIHCSSAGRFELGERSYMKETLALQVRYA